MSVDTAKKLNNKYFANIRQEILPLLPGEMGRVLEVGCGDGNTLAWLKSINKCKWVCGVELFPDAAEKARAKLDEVYEGNIESIILPIKEKSLDAILCLDVLEHLIDPWKVVDYLRSLLVPGGILIASVPNVRHYSVLKALLLHGKWTYVSEGILDKTHLRFFVRDTVIELIERPGLKIDIIKSTGLEKGKKITIANLLTLSLFKPFFEYQYLIKAIRVN